MYELKEERKVKYRCTFHRPKEEGVMVDRVISWQLRTGMCGTFTGLWAHYISRKLKVELMIGLEHILSETELGMCYTYWLTNEN